jgi:hypothetical protein
MMMNKDGRIYFSPDFCIGFDYIGVFGVCLFYKTSVNHVRCMRGAAGRSLRSMCVICSTSKTRKLLYTNDKICRGEITVMRDRVQNI